MAMKHDTDNDVIVGCYLRSLHGSMGVEVVSERRIRYLVRTSPTKYSFLSVTLWAFGCI